MTPLDDRRNDVNNLFSHYAANGMPINTAYAKSLKTIAIYYASAMNGCFRASVAVIRLNGFRSRRRWSRSNAESGISLARLADCTRCRKLQHSCFKSIAADAGRQSNCFPENIHSKKGSKPGFFHFFLHSTEIHASCNFSALSLLIRFNS